MIKYEGIYLKKQSDEDASILDVSYALYIV